MNNDNPNKVITAGGALSSSSSKKKKNKRKSKNNTKKKAAATVANDNDIEEQQQKPAATIATTTVVVPTQVHENPDDTGWTQNASINDLKASKSTTNKKEPSQSPIAKAKDLITLDDLYDTNKSKTSQELQDEEEEQKKNSNGHGHGHGDDSQDPLSSKQNVIWLLFCFLGIMASFVLYGLLLEYATSGGRKLHELSFLFVTSGVYTITASVGRYVRDETPTTIPPARFAILGMTSMGSTFCSVRSLRYVIYPIQVLAKSCKPVPVMIMGALMGKKYPLRKYVNVVLIVLGVALFMGGGSSSSHKKGSSSAQQIDDESSSSPSQIIGLVLLFISLCFDGGTGAYEDKLMSVHAVQPFDLMYNIQLGKTILAGIGLIVLNQLHIFMQMCQDMGFLLIALGLSGAVGQVFIFITISKFGALTCSIIGLLRKVTTLVASIYFYGHTLNFTQMIGLFISVTAMILNFLGKGNKKKNKKSSDSDDSDDNTGSGSTNNKEETESMLPAGDTTTNNGKEPYKDNLIEEVTDVIQDDESNNNNKVEQQQEGGVGDIELATTTK